MKYLMSTPSLVLSWLVAWALSTAGVAYILEQYHYSFVPHFILAFVASIAFTNIITFIMMMKARYRYEA